MIYFLICYNYLREKKFSHLTNMARNKIMVSSVAHYWRTWERLHRGYPIPSPWSPEVYAKIVHSAPEYMKEHLDKFYQDTIEGEYYSKK